MKSADEIADLFIVALIIFALLTQHVPTTTAVTILIPKCHSEISIPLGFPPHSAVFQLDTVNLTGFGDGGGYYDGDIRLGRPRVKKWPLDDSSKDHRETTLTTSDAKKIRSLFTFNESNGTLLIKRDPAGLPPDLTTKDFMFPLEMKNLEECEIGVRFLKNIDEYCDVKNHPCFSGSNTTYLIPESVPPGTTFDYLFPLVAQTLCQNRTIYLSYSVTAGNDLVSVDRLSGALTLLSSLDAEKNQSHNFGITCRVSDSKNETRQMFMNGTISIVDVNDNAPHLQRGDASNILYNVTNTSEFEIRLSVVDLDSRPVNNISVFKRGDHLDLIRIEHDPKEHVFEVDLEEHLKATVFFALLKPSRPPLFTGSIYSFEVIFEDRGLKLNKTQSQVVYKIQLHNVTAEVRELNVTQDVFEVHKFAGRYFSVAQPFSVIKESGLKFHISYSDINGAFNITPDTGIIYVDNQYNLQHSKYTRVSLNVTWLFRKETYFHLFRINIKSDKTLFSSPCNTNSMCARERTDTDCSSSCGHGSVFGYCQWRSFNFSSKPTLSYGTCSPNIKTCPDMNCDELEEMFPFICPQDCAKTVVGEMIEPTNKKGIGMAMGNCFCETHSSCTCYSSNQFGHRVSSYLISKTDLQIVSSTTSQDVEIFNHSGHYSPAEMSAQSSCGQSCVIIVVFVPCGVLIACAILFLYFKNQRQKKNIQNNKHVDVTLSEAPTGYVDDRSLSIVDTQTLSETYCTAKYDYETKWEIQRETIIFEQTLGEGEFGKVVKAQAWGINGLQSYSTVAVKMLKSNGSESELMDLMSEFNLLKEVQHPNVIRLLGACSQKDGPLYVIVEYAELGSLKNFLRLCRHTDFDVTAQLRTIDNPSYLMNGAFLTQHDLLSFAWQIARGMAYLSDMKLVHRDLAARNVLIAAGKIVKISDFGLSRDVYEGDAYFKKSNGRVPVKWMALESLKDHIYTTKSDVWSFGIVLWEIVTLGASPYPGICPERLYQLLNGGYRMEKPENCGDALYRVMKQCWSANSFERPSFKELTRRFDTMLQDTTVYLDLATFPGRPQGECASSSSSDTDEPTTPLRHSITEDPINYGQISFASSISSINS